jgi:hypothetical protein
LCDKCQSFATPFDTTIWADCIEEVAFTSIIVLSLDYPYPFSGSRRDKFGEFEQVLGGCGEPELVASAV